MEIILNDGTKANRRAPTQRARDAGAIITALLARGIKNAMMYWDGCVYWSEPESTA